MSPFLKSKQLGINAELLSFTLKGAVLKFFSLAGDGKHSGSNFIENATLQSNFQMLKEKEVVILC